MSARLTTNKRPRASSATVPAATLEKAVALNAAIQAELLRTSSTVIGEAMAKGILKVGAGVYNLATGRVAVI
jgi:carbonic anhydrase